MGVVSAFRLIDETLIGERCNVKKIASDMQIDGLISRRKDLFEISGRWRSGSQHGDIWPGVNTATKYVASNTIDFAIRKWQAVGVLAKRDGLLANKVAELKQGRRTRICTFGEAVICSRR